MTSGGRAGGSVAPESQRMPFTPFHFGPGLLAKSILPERAFSLQVFVLGQIVSDLQPGIAMLSGRGELHGWTHTYLGALFCALATFAAWRLWERWRPARYATERVSGAIAAVSALLGTLSHVWLDSQYHAEMNNLTPGMLRLVERGDASTSIEMLCVACAVGGLAILGARKLTSRFLHRHQAVIGRSKQ